MTTDTRHRARVPAEPPPLHRDQTFGDKEYSQEERVAEMGSAFLCAQARIEKVTLENSAAYIGNWLQVLKSDSKMLVVAAAQAQRAADLILNRKFED